MVYGNPGDEPPVEGVAAPEFQKVRLEFERNFVERGEEGAACAIYHRGKKVVDLWGGHRCAKTRERWTEQTLVLAFSVTKGMAAAAMAVAHSQGLFELDETGDPLVFLVILFNIAYDSLAVGFVQFSEGF